MRATKKRYVLQVASIEKTRFNNRTFKKTSETLKQQIPNEVQSWIELHCIELLKVAHIRGPNLGPTYQIVRS